MGVGVKTNVRVTSSQGNDFTHDDLYIFFFSFLFFHVKWQKESKWRFSEMVGDAGGEGLVRGKRTERARAKNRAEMRRPNVPAVVGWTEDRSDNPGGRSWRGSRGELVWVSAAGGGAPGMVEELLLCWDREGQRERQHTSVCYCVGEGEKDGGIILMA